MSPALPHARPRVLMLGCYDFQLYSRGRILYKSLQHLGVPVDILLPKGFLRHFALLSRILERNYDVLIVTGKPVLLLCWLTKWLHGCKVLFDVFISDFDTLVFDRKLLKPTSLRAKFYWWLDRFCCRRADFNILDTAEHVDYFVDEFGLAPKMFSVIPVGADDELFAPSEKPRSIPHALAPRPLLVHFHGTYIPLQGAEYIIQAAKLLDGTPVRFRMIGRGQEYGAVRALAQRLNVHNVEFVDLLPLAQLPLAIAEADLCLGAFGVSGKANRVITNKCFEALAMGKPLIAARTGVAERMLGSGAMLVEPGNPKELANAIRTLQRNAALRDDLARRGLQLFRERYAIDRIGEQLLAVLTPLLSAAPTLQHEKTEAPKRLIIRKPVVPDSAFELEPVQSRAPAESEPTEPVQDAGVLESETPEQIIEHPAAPARDSRQRHIEPEIEIVEEPELVESPHVPEPAPPIPKQRTPAPETHSGDPAFLQKLDRLFARAIESQRKPKRATSARIEPPPHSPFSKTPKSKPVARGGGRVPKPAPRPRAKSPKAKTGKGKKRR